MLKWIVMALAVAGLGIGVWTVATSGRDNPEPPPASTPSVNPYPSGIAATGLVEGASRNVQIAAPENGLVTEVSVQVADQVEAGDVLFQLDPRTLEAELVEARSALSVARAELAKAKAAPRAVTLPPLEAAVEKAEAELSLARTEFRQTQRAYENDAATQEELNRRQSALDAAKATLSQARATLREAEAGTWSRDITIAQEKVDQAQARVTSLKERIDRLTVRAPIDGKVLKRRIEPGEYTAPAMNDNAPLVLARLDPLHIRAQVDEEDAPRLREGADAIARVRGAADIRVPLEMVRIEPLAEPKRQLTGVATEVVDTRVIEVVFAVEAGEDNPLYPGMLVDVFIEGPRAATQPATAPQPATKPVLPNIAEPATP
jgi:multidrug efflux pump subunit AcrA (membrane-fusion protein)